MIVNKKLRLDKYLADAGKGTRTEVKQLIKKGRVSINGEVNKSADTKVDTVADEVTLDGKKVCFETYEYFMFHKPAGCVSATQDNTCKTVLDFIKDEDSVKKKELFPVGRLDKDTEGLLLLTNDGDLAHDLLSPKRHVRKTYYVELDDNISQEDMEKLEQGVDIGEKKLTLPAQLQHTEKENCVLITITEGKFHQVKRMFQAVGREVKYLRRVSMGSLRLDECLLKGHYRKLTGDEIMMLKNRVD